MLCVFSVASVELNSLGPCGRSQASLSMGFSRQDYWTGLPCPPSGDLPHPGVEPTSPALQAGSLPTEPPGKPSLAVRIMILLALRVLLS